MSRDGHANLARYGASEDLVVLGGHEHRPSDRVSGGTTAQRLADSLSSALLVLAP